MESGLINSGMTFNNPSAFERIISGAWPVLHRSTDTVEVEAPGGYRFIVDNKPSDGGDPVKAIALSCSNLNRSIDYWSRKCGMNLILSNDKEAVFSYAAEQCNLKLAVIGANVDHASAYGRIAFSCPRDQLLPIQDLMKREGEVVLKDLVSLDTPGKATVEVVILADPDGNEICFVGDEAFRQLSQVDPKADELLMQAIRDDSSDEWYMKHGGKVAE
ncbi:unnamed protein product [Calicophoron daubneyi]|uniref:VOC domain-containing protein n=1 Tax=Calicophoron daubneyi TaxID=300641 RepID=A0AAV2TI13_CALDB